MKVDLFKQTNNIFYVFLTNSFILIFPHQRILTLYTLSFKEINLSEYGGSLSIWKPEILNSFSRQQNRYQIIIVF